MSKFIKYLEAITVLVSFLACVITISDEAPPPPASLTLPLIILQCR